MSAPVSRSARHRGRLLQLVGFILLGGCASCPADEGADVISTTEVQAVAAPNSADTVVAAAPTAPVTPIAEAALPAPVALPAADSPPSSPLVLGNWLDLPALEEAQLAIRDKRFRDADVALDAWLGASPGDARVPAVTLVRDLLRANRLKDATAASAEAPNAPALIASLRAAAKTFPELSDELQLEIAEVQLLGGGEVPAALATLDELVGASRTLAPSVARRERDLRLKVRVALGHQAAIAAELAALAANDPEGLSADGLAIHIDNTRGDTQRAAIVAFITRFARDSRALTYFDALDLEPIAPKERLAMGEALLAAGRYKSARRAVESMTGARDPDAVACAAGLVHGLSLDRSTGRKNYRGQDAVYTYLSRLASRCDGDPGAWATFIAGRNRARAVSRQKTEKKKKATIKAARRLLNEHVERYADRTTADDAYVLLAGLEEDEARADAIRWRALTAHAKGDMAGELAWDLVGPDVRAGNWESLVVDLDRIFKLIPSGPPSRHGGRFAYWRARALAGVGKDAEAQILFRDILSSFPLSYYAVLALSQLCGPDAECATMRLDEAGTVGLDDADANAEKDGKAIAFVDADAWRVLWADADYRRAVAWARLAGVAHTDDALFADRVRDALGDVAKASRPERAAWFWARSQVLQLAGSFARAAAEARSLEDDDGLPFPRGRGVLAWQAAFPRPFKALVDKFAAERDIASAWIWAIARVESNFNPQVTSWANAIGLMQIIPSTAAYLARGTTIDPSTENLKKPEIALELGTLYLSRLLARHVQIPLASAGYNAGGGAVGRWRKEFGALELDRFVESIPYSEAHNYARSVTQTMARYLWIYEQKPMLLQVSGPAASSIDGGGDDTEAGGAGDSNEAANPEGAAGEPASEPAP